MGASLAGIGDFIAELKRRRVVRAVLGRGLLALAVLRGFVLFVEGARRLDEQRRGRVDPVPVVLLTAIYGAQVAFN